ALRSLKSLDMSPLRIPTSSIGSLSSLACLELQLHGRCFLPPEDLECLQCCQQLRSLSVSMHDQPSPVMLYYHYRSTFTLPELRQLTINDGVLPLQALRKLAFPRLEHFHYDNPDAESDTHFRNLSFLRTLESIALLCDGEMQLADLSKECPQLKQAKISCD